MSDKIQDKSRFKLLIMNPDKKIFDGTASSLFLKGNTGEFELLPYHYPVLSLLDEGDIVIDWEKSISINNGIIKFFKNECTVLVELKQADKSRGISKWQL
jgi:F-type H+-transporting ATPase subunit epsilon